MDCVCGNPEGTNKECERCRLLAEIAFLKRVLRRAKETWGPSVMKLMALEIRQSGDYHEYVSPEAQKLNDAMERGDELRDRAKDERAERKQ